jgi:hypothetical protein
MQRDWLTDFKDQCERNLRRSIQDRMRYGFNYVYKPVLDDADWRVFDSMEEYRKWCQEKLPAYLGYGKTDAVQSRARNET